MLNKTKQAGACCWSSCVLQVDECLRVVGHQRVFAVGDATDVKETKLGYLAKAQVLLMCSGVTALWHLRSQAGACGVQLLWHPARRFLACHRDFGDGKIEGRASCQASWWQLPQLLVRLYFML